MQEEALPVQLVAYPVAEEPEWMLPVLFQARYSAWMHLLLLLDLAEALDHLD